MKRILLLGLNDLRLTASERSTFIWMLLMPIAFMWFFGQMGGGENDVPKVALSVEDRDGGWIARAFVDALAVESVRVREITAGGRGEEQRGSRTLIIPEGFTESVLAGERQTVRLEKDPEANEEFSLAAEVHVIRTIVRTIARLVELERSGHPASLEDAERSLRRFNALGDRSPLVGLEVSTAGRGRQVPRGLAQSVPGMLTMMVLMMTVIYGGVFLTLEKRDLMLRRQVALPLTRTQIFLGKLVGRVLMAGLQIAVLVVAGRYLFGLSFGRSPGGLLLLLGSYAFAVAGLATLIGALASTPEQASSIGWMLSMILAAMGGCWWPSEVMPAWLWKGAHILPTAWAMDAFHALISFGDGASAVLLPSIVLLGFGGLFTLVGARTLRPV